MLATSVALLAAPVAAQATLVYVRNVEKPSVWIAEDDGSSAHKLVKGSSPRISPDGSTVLYMGPIAAGNSYNPTLMLVPTNGSAAPRKLASGWRNPEVFAFAPSSDSVAVVLGGEVGKDHLVLIDLETGAKRTIASGYFNGVSFSPESSELVYGMSPSERYPQRSEIYSVSVTGGKPVAITHDDRSLSPVWGPSGEIAFVKELEAKRRRYGPKNEIYLMNPQGGEVRRLTHTKVSALLQGLTPLVFSADGAHLLTEFGGEDTSYAVTVNPQTGAEHVPLKGNAGYEFIASALSSNGETILGTTGGFYASVHHDVATVPYGGGKASILANNAYEPDWNG